ncbi:MAG: hypothetical protein SH817_08610 [Leptospira sp.]|nr:hypothetical protein [Leptospira sp.]
MITELESKIEHYRTVMHLCNSKENAEVYQKLIEETKENISKMRSEDIVIKVSEPVIEYVPPNIVDIHSILRGAK